MLPAMRSSRFGVGTVLALVGVAALAGGVLSLVFHDGGSQAGAVQPSASTERGTTRGPGYGMRMIHPPSRKQMLQRRKQFQADLAKELGVSTDKVEKAFKALFEKRLDRAVDAGRLTRKQANRMRECYDSAKCKLPFRRHLRFRGGRPGPGAPPPGVGVGPGAPEGGPPEFGPPM
jgi:hypothetical protein